MTYKPERVRCHKCFGWLCEVDPRTKAPIKVRPGVACNDVGANFLDPSQPSTGYAARCRAAGCKAVTEWARTP